MQSAPSPTTAALSSQTLDALAEAITGGSGFGTKPSVGKYRSRWHLEKFFEAAGHAFILGGRSRVPAVREYLAEIVSSSDGRVKVIRLLECVTDPRDYILDPDALEATVNYLNRFLEFDDLELVREGKAMRVRRLSSSGVVVEAFAEKTIALDFDAVNAEVARALESADRDPPVAVTAACVIIESVCRAILSELDIEAPAKRDVDGLLRAVQEPLGLSPSRSDLSPLIAADVKQVLGGLTTVAKGVGALRTHGGSAHATEVGQVPIDGRIARFAIHSASTVALFLVETWERKKRRVAGTQNA